MGFRSPQLVAPTARYPIAFSPRVRPARLSYPPECVSGWQATPWSVGALFSRSLNVRAAAAVHGHVELYRLPCTHVACLSGAHVCQNPGSWGPITKVLT